MHRCVYMNYNNVDSVSHVLLLYWEMRKYSIDVALITWLYAKVALTSDGFLADCRCRVPSCASLQFGDLGRVPTARSAVGLVITLFTKH
jgi:hypothetical protein